ncbi:hypothetical protein MKW92_044494, partial [Papaver armeniacum]
CLGCCTKPAPTIVLDDPSKGLRIQGRTVKKPSILEDFWSTSTCEMDNSAIQSQHSVSSISTSNQTLDSQSGAGKDKQPTEIVNHVNCSNPTPQVQESRLSWNATYDSLLGTNKLFPHPIPLSVSHLVYKYENNYFPEHIC